MSCINLGRRRATWLTRIYERRFDHFTAKIENLTIHFIHQKSTSSSAIPLILNHGWPGSFLEFVPLIDALTQSSTLPNGNDVAFDLVIPSLPGYAFSSPAPAGWTVTDTARVLNTLMTHVLGYPTYAVHGTDVGSAVGYSMYESFNRSVRAAHFSFLPFFPLTPDSLAAQNITLSPLESFEAQRVVDWSATGSGYFIEQATKVCRKRYQYTRSRGAIFLTAWS